MDQKQFYRTLLTLGFPIMVQSFVTTFLNMVDTFMISGLSNSAIAGVGAANRIYFLLHLFLFGTATGGAVLASQYWGVKNVKAIQKVLGLILTIGLTGAFLFTLVALFIPETVMGVFTNEEMMIAYGSTYLSMIAFAYIPTAISTCYAFILRTTHHVKLPVMVSIFFIGVNTFLNWVLIYGNLGFPAMGVRGAALATVIARLGETLTLVSLVYALKMPAAASLKVLVAFEKAFVVKFIKTAAPVMSNEILWAVGVTGYAIIYGRLGEVVMASMTIAQSVEQIAFILFYGMSSAGSILLGNALGAGHFSEAATYAKRIIRLFIGIGIVTTSVLFLTTPMIVSLFPVDMEVQATVTLILRIFSIYIPFRALNLIIIVAILRSGGDTVAAMLIDVVGVWLVGLPLGLLAAFVFKLPIGYVYALILSEEVVKVIVGLIRFKKGKWLKNLVTENNEVVVIS